MTRAVATIPAEPARRYAELWRALEEAYPVRFIPRGRDDLGGVDAVIAFPGERAPERIPFPCLELRAGPPPDRGSSLAVAMARSDGLDPALRGQMLVEDDRGRPDHLDLDDGWDVLAEAGGSPVWARHRSGSGRVREVAAAVPSELVEHEYLRDHLTAGHFWSLLPLVHFLKRLTGGSEHPAPLRGCIVIDDPNPRLPSYGYVEFSEIARDARECGYHVAVATIPLDLIAPGHRAAGVFQEFGAQLSLVLHGNNHVHRELDRPGSDVEADRMIGSATTRVERFERRVGIRVERVMCPPHGACGPYALRALFRHGFHGLAASRPFPWDAFADHRHWRLGGWLPAQLAGGGIPVVPRYSLKSNLDDLAFRAFLGQPLILYCHHDDIRDGLEPFRTAAARAAQLGDMTWASLASIAQRNATCVERDGVAAVRLHSRDVRLPELRAPVVRIDVPRVFDAGDTLGLVVNGVHVEAPADEAGRFSVTTPVQPEGQGLHVRIITPDRDELPGARTADWLPGPWPVVRRVLTESRDRALPVLRGLGR